MFSKSLNQGQGIFNPSNINQVGQVVLQKDMNKIQLGWLLNFYGEQLHLASYKGLDYKYIFILSHIELPIFDYFIYKIAISYSLIKLIETNYH